MLAGMAVVSPVLSQEWSFINPFDTPSYSLELADCSSVIHSTKRRARDIEWDQDDEATRNEVRTKKAKTSVGIAVDSHQLRKETESTVTLSSTTTQPPIEQVLSIIVDALTSNCKSSSPPSSTPASISPELAQPIVSISATTEPSRKLVRPTPTSPLSNCSDRARFVRKIIGGSCSGKTEPELCRWVLSRNHFLNVRCLDPSLQSEEWNQSLMALRWHYAHPYYQRQAAAEMADTWNAMEHFSNWVEDEGDYDTEEYVDGDWSDEEGEEGEFPEELDGVHGHTDVWDSGIPLQLPVRPQ